MKFTKKGGTNIFIKQISNNCTKGQKKLKASKVIAIIMKVIIL